MDVLWSFFCSPWICTAQGAVKVGAAAPSRASLGSTWLVAVGGEGVETDLASRSCGVQDGISFFQYCNTVNVFFFSMIFWSGWMGRFFWAEKLKEKRHCKKFAWFFEVWGWVCWKIVSPQPYHVPMHAKSRLSRETGVMAIWRKRLVAGWSWF